MKCNNVNHGKKIYNMKLSGTGYINIEKHKAYSSDTNNNMHEKGVGVILTKECFNV